MTSSLNSNRSSVSLAVSLMAASCPVSAAKGANCAALGTASCWGVPAPNPAGTSTANWNL